MTNPKDAIGARKAALGVVPAALVLAAAPAMAHGAAKYGPFNWRSQPVQAMTYVEAALRHLYAWIDGQDDAEDTGISHIGHALAGLGILADAFASGNVIDNRPPKGPAADMLREQDKSTLVQAWKEALEEPRPLHWTVSGVESETWGTGDGPVYDATRLACAVCRTFGDHSIDCPLYR